MQPTHLDPNKRYFYLNKADGSVWIKSPRDFDATEERFHILCEAIDGAEINEYYQAAYDVEDVLKEIRLDYNRADRCHEPHAINEQQLDAIYDALKNRGLDPNDMPIPVHAEVIIDGEIDTSDFVFTDPDFSGFDGPDPERIVIDPQPVRTDRTVTFTQGVNFVGNVHVNGDYVQGNVYNTGDGNVFEDYSARDAEYAARDARYAVRDANRAKERAQRAADRANRNSRGGVVIDGDFVQGNVYQVNTGGRTVTYRDGRHRPE